MVIIIIIIKILSKELKIIEIKVESVIYCFDQF